MNKRSINKLLPVWLAVSAVFIIAGIILLCLLDFNYTAENGKNSTVEVEFGVITINAENGEEQVTDACDKAVKDAGVTVLRKVRQEQVDSESFGKTFHVKIVYEISADVGAEKLASVKTAVLAATASFAENDSDFAVTVHDFAIQTRVYAESYWRGALAIGVAVFVALIYVGVRYGVGCALTGLTVCAHDAVLTAALFAVFRIPVYFYGPLVYAAVAALVSVILWLLQCMKLKDTVKNPEFAASTADEIVCKVRRENWLLTVCCGGALALFAIIAGAVATPLSRIFFFSLTVPAALPLYSSLIVGPALHVHVKTAFDKWKETHGKNKGKKKSVKAVETES